MSRLENCKVAILATDGFERSELFEPKKALEDAGATVKIISLKMGDIKSWSEGNWNDHIQVDATVDQVNAEQFDALMLPGGTMNPDKLRINEKAVSFVRAFAEAGKPIAAICHAPSLLVSADIVRGRKLTSYPSVKVDLVNAGAQWEDREVVTDKGLVTSRNPNDIPAFNKKMIEEFAEGRHQPQVQQNQQAQRSQQKGSEARNIQ